MKSEQFQVHVEMEERHWWFLGRRVIMRELVHRLIPPSKVATVVDIGCGTGGNIALLGTDYACVGIDPSEEAVRRAQERFPDVRFCCASVPDGAGPLLRSAGLVLLMDVLEHTPDDFEFFSRILDCVTPGAYLLVTVPAKNSLWTEHDVSFGHYRRYERDRLTRVWSGLPVEPLLVSYYNSRLYPVIRIIRAFNRWAGRTSGSGGTDFAIPAPAINGALRGILAGEARVLVELLQGTRRKGYSSGASLIALLLRSEGAVLPRAMPESCRP